MGKHVGGNLIVIKATIDEETVPGQYRIENETRDIDGEWDDIYVCVSGYFGAAGPHVFAAAPELLEALEEVVAVFESNPSSITDTVWVTGDRPETLYDCCRAAIAKAKGEK